MSAPDQELPTGPEPGSSPQGTQRTLGGAEMPETEESLFYKWNSRSSL